MPVDPFSIGHKIGRHLDMLSRLGRNQAWTALFLLEILFELFQRLLCLFKCR